MTKASFKDPETIEMEFDFRDPVQCRTYRLARLLDGIKDDEGYGHFGAYLVAPDPVRHVVSGIASGIFCLEEALRPEILEKPMLEITTAGRDKGLMEAMRSSLQTACAWMQLEVAEARRAMEEDEVAEPA